MGKKKIIPKPGKRKFPLDVIRLIAEERTFAIFIGFCLILSALVLQYTYIAMWFGFIFAAYSAVANDSIQSLGTFIESNRDKKWWFLWLFTGLIFLVTVTASYLIYDGDVTYQRLLDSEGNTKYPNPYELEQQGKGNGFSYLQLIAPLVLLVLTRLRMPVSTTFLLLSVFSANTSGITSVVVKSLSGYILAFILSFIIWYAGYNFIKTYFKSRQAHVGWTVVQWVISGSLWSVWLMQDASNIAVYLPRTLNIYEFIGFAGVIFGGLGILFYLRGDKIQDVVSEKVRISDVRAATLVDFTYVLLMLYKLFISNIPMSTTWVFLGVIGGREIAVSLSRKKEGTAHKKKALRMVGKDSLMAAIGLAVSILLAIGVNEGIRNSIADWFMGLFS
jgi:hypothetical protein